MNELSSCPFCNSVFVTTSRDYRKWYVLCNNCGASSGNYRTRELAIENWNRREGMKDDAGKSV